MASDMGYNDSAIINIPDKATGLKMLDSLTRIKNGRRIQPLSMTDNIKYDHRYLYSQYNLQIGDTYFMIPPEFIMVNSEATSQPIVTLRQENSTREKYGHHKRTILIDLVFNGINQLNGFPVNGPEGIYYVDGLRQLLAQFKCTPFLPINNELINGMYGIFTVVLQSINISTVKGFPDMMIASITLQEVNMFPYLEMPDVCYQYMIDWDLFRFYYQRLLSNDPTKHIYKKLQSFPSNKEHNRFKISILNESVFNEESVNEYNFLDILCKDENFLTWVDSDKDNCVISDFQCGYSNLLTNIQLSDGACPTVQFMGGMDTIYNISFETTDYSVVQSLEQCQISNDLMSRNNAKYRSLGFVKLESELVEFTGSLFVVIESVTTNTVPGFPGLYNVQINCVSFDIAQSERESLNGFLPFDCNNGKCGEYVSEQGFVSDHVHKEQAIEQSMAGLKTKIKQDAYAEWKLRTTMEVYPDLRLPKYKEVNSFISKCISFRTKNGLNNLPYKKYPTNPVCMMHGNSISNSISASGKIVKASDLSRSSLEYDGYVDPDFYVFYPDSYEAFEKRSQSEDGESYYDIYDPKKRKGYSKTKTVKHYPFSKGKSDTTASGSNSNIIEEFIAVLEAQVGNKYRCVNAADGRLKDENGKMIFDCSGFVTYGLRQIGAMSQSDSRLVVKSIPGKTDLFTEVPWEEKQRGDCLVKTDLSHVTVYLGNNRIVHAANTKNGVCEGNQYFTASNGRCFRPNIFSQVSSSGGGGNYSSDAAGVWSALKSYGLSDIACAGIIGNMMAESGVNSSNVQGSWKKSNPAAYNSNYVSQVDNGSVSRNNFVYNGPGGGGFGLVQFTYSGYKAQLYDEAKAQGKSVSDVGVQVSIFINQIKASGVFDKLNSAGSIREASNTMLLEYEKPRNQGQSVQEKRASNAQNAYNSYAGTGGSSADSGSSATASSNVLTNSEFDSICRVVQAQCSGQKSETYIAVAQSIYDRLTSEKYGGLGNILNNRDQYDAPTSDDILDGVKNAVTSVFCDNTKYSEYVLTSFLTPDSNISTFKINDNLYDRIGEIGSFTFWGKSNKQSSSIKYIISDKAGTGNSSTNSSFESHTVAHNAYDTNASDFGEPLFLQTEAIIYDEGWDFWNNNESGSAATSELNSGLNLYNTSFVNDKQYSCRGRLIRAFPTYLFCILDDQSQWYDGRKLWANYYVHKSIIDISVHGTNDMPTETATIVVNNSYHNLDRVSSGVSGYSIANDPEYSGFQKWFYKNTNMLIGLGPKLTDRLIELHQVICNHAMLREGARIHLRMGYGSDPMSLAPMMNGFISDVQLGDQISIVATSDGSELIQHITSSNEKDTNNGWFGLFGLGEDQEPSNIIANVMCKRQSWVNYFVGTTFEGSKYSIEHFGLYFNQSAMGAFAWAAAGTVIGTKVAPGLGSLIGLGVGTLAGVLFSGDISVSDLWNGYAEQYDICKNIYKANYKRENYIYASTLEWDDENNVVFNKYNMTPWDVMQMCTQVTPEYIVKPSYHQFDSRLYFGLPFWMERYRYDYLGGKVYEECKASTQVHLLESVTNIIDNQVKVTSRYSNTNCKVMYTRGSSSTSTQIIHSDDTIDYSKQKTTIIDSSITQDALGPDIVYEFLGYDIGEESARRMGISNLLYGWQQQYQGQLICSGLPGIYAHDFILVNDMYSNLYGIALVREVVHSFSTNTGFTTSITPGMVGFSTDEQSGLIESCGNYLDLLNNFSSYVTTRRILRNNYEANINVFANFEILKSKVNSVYDESLGYNNAVNVLDNINTIGGVAGTLVVARNIYKLAKAGKVINTFAAGYKAVKGVSGISKIVNGVINGIGVVALGGAPETGGLSLVVGVAVMVIIDVLIGEVLEWLSNKNVCTLLPMWWDGYPFAAGVKDGTHILLADNNSTATNETDKGIPAEAIPTEDN